MRLSELHIGRYGPLREFSHEFEDNLEVFFGPNESGKTLLLEGVLKLLSPEIEAVFPGVNRVAEQPSGYLYLETGTGEEQLGDGVSLDDIANITPTQLRNVFVVRDSDLDLRDEHAFYDSVTQRIGDLHTNEIEAVQSRLVEAGRLTSLNGRGLSRASGKDDAKDVRDAASDLVGDMTTYIERAEAADIPGTEREFLSVKAELQRCEEELTVQQDAAAMDRHATLSDRLAEYQTAVESIDETFTRETLQQLYDLDRDVDRADAEIDQLTQQREQLREDNRGLAADRDAIEAELRPVEDRRDDVTEAERALAEFRAAHAEAIGSDRGMTIAKYAALGGISGGGLGAVVGSTIAGVLLAVIGVIALGWYVLQHRSVQAAERERETVLHVARDAGLPVDVVEDVAPAIQEFRDRIEELGERRDSLENEIAVTERRLADVEEELETVRETRQETRAEVQEILSNAGVDDIEAYEEAVNHQEALIDQRNSAEQSLVDTLGTPDTTEPAGKVGFWRGELKALIVDVDESVTADQYDADRLAALEAQYENLTGRREALNSELEEHEERLEEFAERVQEISAEPFLDDEITLASRTLEGLREVVPELERVVEQINRDADVAREALDIFDGLKAEEEQKITDLFGPDSRATEVFHRITGGRYDDVSYDTENRALTVRRDGDNVYTADQLSHGAKTQLYLAARVGLGEQLFEAEPGFFLMDDAFLPADGTRLREGFEVLEDLAADGWQVLYFTAKDEVGQDIVAASNVRCRELGALE